MVITQNLSATRSLTIGPTSLPEYNILRVDVEEAPSVVAGPTTYDSETTNSITAGAWSEYLVESTFEKLSTFTVQTPAVCSMVGNRITKLGTGGIAVVKITQGAVSAIFTGNVASGQKTVNRFSGYVNASLSDVLADAIVNRLTPGKQREYFTSYTSPMGGSPPASYTPNMDCWLAGVNVSGCPVSTTIFDQHSSANRGALITTRHLVGAAHWLGGVGYRLGDTIRFRGSDGTMHNRTVIGKSQGFGDAIVATLDSALPASVSPFRIVGQWIAPPAKRTATSYYMGGAFFFLDQQYRAHWLLGRTTGNMYQQYRQDVIHGGTTYEDLYTKVWFTSPDIILAGEVPSFIAGKTDFMIEAVIGDSGSPVFALAGSEPLLVTTWHGSTTGPAFWNYDGVVLNYLITLSDANAGVSTGLTVTVAPDPTL